MSQAKALPIQPTPPRPQGQGSDWLLKLRRWWAEFSLQTKLLAVATLVVSLLMTGITFFALNGIQRDAQMSDTRYARDLGLLLSANVTPWWRRAMTGSWPRWRSASGDRAAACATSSSPMPKG